MALSKKWLEPEAKYRQLQDYKLGTTQFVKVDDNIIVANMIAQEGTGYKNGPPIRYDALRQALALVNNCAEKIKNLGHTVSIHMPKIGSGLAGGKWPIIEQIIMEELNSDVYVYILESEYNA